MSPYNKCDFLCFAIYGFFLLINVRAQCTIGDICAFQSALLLCEIVMLRTVVLWTKNRNEL